MKIKDIQDKDTRIRAIINSLSRNCNGPCESEAESLEMDLSAAFNWDDSPEGHKFWQRINQL